MATNNKQQMPTDLKLAPQGAAVPAFGVAVTLDMREVDSDRCGTVADVAIIVATPSAAAAAALPVAVPIHAIHVEHRSRGATAAALGAGARDVHVHLCRSAEIAILSAVRAGSG